MKLTLSTFHVMLLCFHKILKCLQLFNISSYQMDLDGKTSTCA